MAPTSGKKPAAKKAVKKDASKKKAKKGVESYKLYIFKVLKQVHPDTGISSKAMAILNSFIADQFEKIASQAAQVSIVALIVRVLSRSDQAAGVFFPGWAVVRSILPLRGNNTV